LVPICFINTKVVRRAIIVVIARSIRCRCPLADSVIALQRKDAGICIGALVQVIAAGTFTWYAKAYNVAIRLLACIIDCARVVVIARQAFKKLSTADEQWFPAKRVRCLNAHIFNSAIIVVITVLPCSRGPHAADKFRERQGGCDSSACIIVGARVRVIADLSNVCVSQAHWHVSTIYCH
jgi:hypothetical protein